MKKMICKNPRNQKKTIMNLTVLFFLSTGIYFRVIGKSKCSWTEFLVRESKAAEGKETSDARYWGKEEHLNPVVYIIGSKNGIYL